MFKKLPKNKYFLAPLAGINDPAFRLACQEQGAGLTYTELTSIDYIYSEKQKALNEIKKDTRERCVGLQLFGKKPEKIKETIELIDDKFEFYDFNSGCPANNILGQGAGGELMGNPKLLIEMLEKIIKHTNKPVTLKYRLGLNKHKENFLEIGKQAEDIGIDMITLHARHVNQRYSGTAKWDRIKKIKEKLNIPITGNGDIKKPEDAKKMMNNTKCDYTMIGRWARGNPYCFKQLIEYEKKGKYEEIKPATKLKGFLKYAQDAKEREVGFARIKIHAMQYTKGITGSVELRKKIAKSKNREQIIKSFKDFIKK